MSLQKRLSIKRKGAPPRSKNTKGTSFFSSFRKTKKTKSWKVLITGGAGHLAENLVKKLLEQIEEDVRHEVSAEVQRAGSWDSPELPNDKRSIKNRMLSKIEQGIHDRLAACISITLVDVIEPNPKLLNKYINFVSTSFDDAQGMKTALEGVDTVFHLAAVGMTGQYARDRKACMDINAVGTMNLLTWAKHAGVRRFIYTSSIGVIFTGKPLKDATELTPYPDTYCNFYCESKAQAERIVVKASTQEMRTTVLRFNGIYGPGEKRVTERVVKFMRSGLWIGLCKPKGQEAITQLSSVANCVQGLVKAELTLRMEDSPHGQIYNIMDAEACGTFTFWSPLHRALGFKNEMYDIPEYLLRWLARMSQNIADFLQIDPFVSMLEIDLLLISSTFSTKKASHELGYQPYPSSMPEIVEMYSSMYGPPTPEALEHQRKFNRKLMMVGAASVTIFTMIVAILYIFYYLLHSYFFQPLFMTVDRVWCWLWSLLVFFQ